MFRRYKVLLNSTTKTHNSSRHKKNEEINYIIPAANYYNGTQKTHKDKQTFQRKEKPNINLSIKNIDPKHCDSYK